jgi:3-phosphoshikimate 1-carboxyvinyltransferase
LRIKKLFTQQNCIMNVTVRPSSLSGSVTAPASKSLTQRAIAAGLLSDGTTVIRNPSFCNDSRAAIAIARRLGANISTYPDHICVETGPRPVSTVKLKCGESGLALRMFSPIASLISNNVTLTGEGSLLRRPVSVISEALPQLGVTVETNGGFMPVTLRGKITGGRAVIDGSSGSQVLTGLLMTLPLLDIDSELIVTNLKSKPYISLTLELLSDFGISVEHHDFRHFIIQGRQSYRAHEYHVEGDWSGAAFLLVAGAIAGEITVSNLNSDSMQADRAVLRALSDAGAHLTIEGNQVKTKSGDLRPFTIDATDSPDLFPPLAALASYCHGTSSIRGVSRLANKESDRATAIIETLSTMNIHVYTEGNALLIDGGHVAGGTVSSHNDHRIAMMAAVMAIGSRREVTVTGAEAVDKSFPEFFDTLKQLGVMMD